MATVPNVSLVAPRSEPTRIYLLVGDTRFPINASDFTSLGFRGDRVRSVDQQLLDRFIERPLSTGLRRPSDVFFDCETAGPHPPGNPFFNCQTSNSLIQRDILVAGWLKPGDPETPPSPWINRASNGIEDIHYNLTLDPVFVERVYGPAGLSLRLDGVSYPGNPAASAVPLPFACPPSDPGGQPAITFNSWILPASGDDIHGELNSWHTRNTAGWFRQYIVGRGPAPAGWSAPLSADPDAYFPFDPFNPDGRERSLRAGDYVVMRGPLWEDQLHGDPENVNDDWDVGPTRHHGWLEMHPIDWVVRVAEPHPNARTTSFRDRLMAPSGPGASRSMLDQSVYPSFAPSGKGKVLEVRKVVALSDYRPGMTLAWPLEVRTTKLRDHVDVGVTVSSHPVSGRQARWKGCWLVEWSERDDRDSAWIDDETPVEARELSAGEGWHWIEAAPEPFLGRRSHVSPQATGTHQHYFSGVPLTPQVQVGDVLFAMAWLDPDSAPEEIMVQWYADGWDHRAFWGADLIPWGISGTASRSSRGPLPFAGEWVRLEAPARDVGLEHATVSGMAFTAHGGRVVWDRAGVSSSLPQSRQLRVSVTPRTVYEGTREITVSSWDATTGVLVPGRVLSGSVDLGPTNHPVEIEVMPGAVKLSVASRFYEPAIVELVVRREI